MSLIIRAVGLPVIEALLVHAGVRVVVAIGLVSILILLGLSSDDRRRDERSDHDCKSKYPYVSSYSEFQLRLLISVRKNVRMPSAWLADKERCKIQTSSFRPATRYSSSLLQDSRHTLHTLFSILLIII